MAHAWMNVVYLNDAEYNALLAERKAKPRRPPTREQHDSDTVRGLRARRDRRRRSCVACSAQQIPEPRRGFGASVTGAYEGWFYNPDGSRSFLVGYYNRNDQQQLDIPIGAEQPDRAGRPRHGPADALPSRAASWAPSR